LPAFTPPLVPQMCPRSALATGRGRVYHPQAEAGPPRFALTPQVVLASWSCRKKVLPRRRTAMRAARPVFATGTSAGVLALWVFFAGAPGPVHTQQPQIP